MTNPAMIPIRFDLVSFQPDKRQYKTAMPVFEASDYPIVVVVEVPLQHEYIYNSEEFILAQTSGEQPPDPQLTIKGWAYIEDAFLNRIDKPEDAIDQSENDEIKWEGDEL